MGDATGNSNIAPSLKCRVRFCTFNGPSAESFWVHLQAHHGAPAVEGSSANFRIRWLNSATAILGHRVVGLMMYSGRRFSVWVLEDSDEVHFYTKEVRDVASTPSSQVSLTLSSEQDGTTAGVKFTGQNGVLTVSRETVLENLSRKCENTLEAWVSIQLDNDQMPATPMCRMDGIAETSVPVLDNSVLHSSRITAGASPEPLSYSPIEKSGDQDSLDVQDGSTDEASVMTVVEASPGGLFDVSEPPLCDPTNVEPEAPAEKVFTVENRHPSEPCDLPQAVEVHSEAKTTSAKVQLTSKLPKPKWRY